MVTLRLAFLFLGCIAAGQVQAACTRPLRAGVIDSGVLYSHSTRDGLDAAITRELAARQGCTVLIEEMPRQQIWLDLMEGRVDLAPSTLRTTSRLNQAYFLPWTRLKTLTILRSSVEARELPTFAAHPGLRLGAIRAFAYGPILDAVVARLRREPGRLVENTMPRSLMEDFRAGRVDAFLANPILYPDLKGLVEGGSAVVRDWVPHEGGLENTLALSLKSFDEEAVRQWGGALTAMRQDGSLKTILRRYLPDDAAEALLPVP
jgi:ABC-type amino acid transport substrate-binding protein